MFWRASEMLVKHTPDLEKAQSHDLAVGKIIDAIWHHKTLSMVPVMAWCLLDAKLLPITRLPLCQMNPQEQMPVKF